MSIYSSSRDYLRSSRGNPHAVPRVERVNTRQNRMSDGTRRILLKTARRSPGQHYLSSEPRYLEQSRVTYATMMDPRPFTSLLPGMYRYLFGFEATPQGFLQSRAGLVFMTVSWLSLLSSLYETTPDNRWYYPLLHSLDGLNDLSPPVYYATAASLLLLNSYVTAYAAEMIGRYVAGFAERVSEKVTGVRTSQMLSSRTVPVIEPTHGAQPGDPYSAFQRPLYSTSMPLTGPSFDTLKPGRFLQSNAGLAFLTAVWFGYFSYLYRTTGGGHWYYNLLHALDGLKELSPPAYLLATLAVMVAGSHLTAYVADKVASGVTDLVDRSASRVQETMENVGPVSSMFSSSKASEQSSVYNEALLPRVFRSHVGVRV